MKFQSANPNELSDKDGNRLCRGSFAGGVQLIIHFSVFPNEKMTGKLCAQRQDNAMSLQKLGDSRIRTFVVYNN